MPNNKTSADYIIVGAGSAGCALAYRLGMAGADVLLLEHGNRDGGLWNWKINMPAALSYPMNMPRYDWGLHTEPEAQLNGRVLVCPRGKVWGGSSAINGMVYVRGHVGDYDHWQQAGAAGWSGRAVMPYFRRLETVHGVDADGAHWRGDCGPVQVTRAAATNPLHPAFIAAGSEAGFNYTADYNGEVQEGVCHFDQTIFRGVRQSAARAYLAPALQLPNVVLTQALVQRVCFEKSRAVAVEARVGDALVRFHAKREVILSASAIHSPKLLLLSGIGDENALRKVGITPVVHRPGVGQNLQDHLEAYIQQQCKQPVTLNSQLGLFSKGAIGARWLLFQTGAGASNHFESGAFLRSPQATYPDMQFHFLPAAIRYDGKLASAGHGFQAHVGHMRSAARGSVELVDANPQTPPRIRLNYMSSDADWKNFRHAIRTVRAIFRQPAMAEFCGTDIAPVGESDAALDAYIRAHAESAYHVCGSCKMGAADDKTAVTDSHCRVFGIDNLRVVDSSIFPRIPYGNTNAPSMMVGEKAAAHILKQELPPDNSSLR
ncbi:MAG: choline dehydrogenase [Proteobacteria bacterium]|nr:choline dehydrogenase [Pseudomonadota bacterium]